jgi:autophagy-related protein 11
VSRQTSIPAQCIITLTPQGKPLKAQTLQTEVGDMFLGLADRRSGKPDSER